MDQTEFINNYCNTLKLAPSIIPAVKSYLLGETESTADIPARKGYIPYNFTKNLMEYFTKDIADTAKRAYRLLGIMSEYEMIRDGMYENDVFKTYFEAGMTEAFIEKAISKRIDINDRFFQFFSRLKESMEKRKDLYSIGEAFYYYEDFIYKVIRRPDDSKLESKDIVVLKALSKIWSAGDEVKGQESDALTRNVVFSALKGSYEVKDLQTQTTKALFSAESAELYNNVKTYLAVKGNLNLLAFTICYCFKDETPWFRDGLRLCFAMEEPILYKEWMKESIENLFNLQMSLDLPLEIPFSLATKGIFLEDFVQNGAANAKLLFNCYEVNKDTFINLCREFQKELRPEAFPMLSVLCRDDKGWHSEADDLLLLYVMQLKKTAKFKFIPEGTVEEARQYIHELAGSDDAGLEYRKDTMTQIAVCASAIYDYSPAAKDILSILLRSAVAAESGRLFLDILYAAGKGFLNNFNMQEALEDLALTAGAKCVCTAYSKKQPGAYHPDFLLFAKSHLSDAEAVFNETREKQDDTIQNKVNIFYSEDIGLPYEKLSLVLEHRLKTMVNFVEWFMADKEDKLRTYVEKIANGKNKNGKEAAIRLIKLWDTDKIAAELAAITDIYSLTDYVKGMYDPKNKSRIPYIELLSTVKVHIKGKQEMPDPILLEYYLSEYMLLKEVQKINTCEKIREFLEPHELNALMQEIYLQWLRDGADTKLKNILIPYAAGANVSQITEYKKQIDSFTENSRGALAAFMVTALSQNNSDLALLLIDGISKKYKNKQVKASAEAAMESAANTLGITKEALGDKIIPTLSFSKNREAVFDYGSRKFKGILTDKLDVVLYDDAGKIIKNLPKASAKDDKELAEAAITAYKDLKKQLKAVIASQKVRLEDAVITGRRWSREQWEHVFVDNPIMNCFATGLIWEEVTEAGRLLGTFRYMSDGSFNSSEEEEYEFSEGSYIVLLHPLDVSEEIKEAWKTQLEDYEITQPITQLSMPVYVFTPDELNEKAVKRYYGKKVYFGTIRGIMDKYDWKKTAIIDGGGYSGYYYEDAAYEVGIQITFDFLYVGMESSDTAKIETIEFYKSKTISHQGYTYDDINDNNRVRPKDVPDKLACFALMAGDLIAQKAI